MVSNGAQAVQLPNMVGCQQEEAGGGYGEAVGAGKPRQVRPSPRKSNKEEDHREENTGLQNGAPAEHISVLHDKIEDAQGVRG